MKIIEGKLALKGSEKVLIINARFNHIITDRLVEGAKDAFIRHGGKEENLSLMLVPGAFEIPVIADKMAASGKYDAVIPSFGMGLYQYIPEQHFYDPEISGETLKQNLLK